MMARLKMNDFYMQKHIDNDMHCMASLKINHEDEDGVEVIREQKVGFEFNREAVMLSRQ
jgi:hypothetical protein